MTIQEAIDTVNSLKPNQFTDSEKVRWLAILDGRIKTEIIDTHEGTAEAEFTPYTDDTSKDKKMLVPFPFDDMYVKWLEAQIDYHNGELAKYSNSMSMFNNIYSDYFAYYNKKYMPKGTKQKYW